MLIQKKHTQQVRSIMLPIKTNIIFYINTAHMYKSKKGLYILYLPAVHIYTHPCTFISSLTKLLHTIYTPICTLLVCNIRD